MNNFVDSIQLSPKREAKLFCRYRHNNHPYLLLQPVKEEQILDDPAIFFFHDILNDNEIQEIKTLAMPRVCIETERNDSPDKITFSSEKIR